MLTFLEPSAFWLLLTLPVIVLLFLIRQRRQQQEVSALFLWTEAVLAARRRRRISPALLLLVQLLLAALLAFALAQPRLRLTGVPPRVLVVDASASMAAAGPAGSRMQEAASQAEALLAGAGEVAVVRAGLGAAVAQPPTGEHARVRQALRELVAADARADLAGALALAREIAPGAEVHLLSDSAPPAGYGDVVTHPVGEAVSNYGISAFDLAYGQLFISVVGNSRVPQNVEVVVAEDAPGGAEVRTSVLVPAGGQGNVSLPLAAEGGRYRARLEAPPDDALGLDNEAFAGTRALTLRLVGDAPALRRLLEVLPGTAQGGEANVTVAVGGPSPSGDAVVFAPREKVPQYTEVVDFAADDPLLRFADLTGVVVAPSSAPLPLPLADAEVLARTADLRPVLLRWRSGGRTLIYFAFHPEQSDLPRRPAFPIVMANALGAFRGEARVPLGTPLPGGDLLTEPGRVERAGNVYTSAPLPASESRLAVAATATGPERTAAAGESEATRNPALWLVGGALVLLLGEWLLWSRGRGLSPVRIGRSASR